MMRVNPDTAFAVPGVFPGIYFFRKLGYLYQSARGSKGRVCLIRLHVSIIFLGMPDMTKYNIFLNYYRLYAGFVI